MTNVSSIRNDRPLRAFVLGTLIAVAAALAQGAWAAPFGGYRDGPGIGMMGGHMTGRMLDSVDATPEQRTRIQEIMSAAQADLRSQREGARGLHDQAVQVFTQPSVDARAAEALRQQMMAQHDQASRRMLQAMLDVSAVLTPAQRSQLAERMTQRREMMQRHLRERGAASAPSR